MRAILAFSGDPITFGHFDVVSRAARTYDEVVVAIGENPDKSGNYLFSFPERLKLANKCLNSFDNVSCITFKGLLGEYAYRNGFDVIVRGVRNNTDLEAELVQFSVNETLHPSVDTVFFPTRRHLSHISSGVVKAIVAEGGDVSKYCQLCVKEELEKRILNKFTVGIAGGIAAGKSYVAKKMVSELNKYVKASYISLDSIGHYVLESSNGEVYQRTRDKITEIFGQSILKPNGAIDRKKLGKVVFSSPNSLGKLDKIMHEPMMARLYEETRELSNGIIVIEGAILVEAEWTNLVNNNVILVNSLEKIRLKRLIKRANITEREALSKIRRQITAGQRKRRLQHQIKNQGWGRLWDINNTGKELDLTKIAKQIIDIANPNNGSVV